MADVVTIPENIFYIIIAVIAVIGIIIVFMQWRRVREAQTNVEFLEKQAQLRKIELVEKDLESKRMMEMWFPYLKSNRKDFPTSAKALLTSCTRPASFTVK